MSEEIKPQKAKSKNTAMIIGVSILVAVSIIIGIVTVVLVANMGKESTTSIVGDMLIIDGSYGAEIELADSEVTMLDSLPVLTRRNNGYASGIVKKGDFSMENFEDSIYLNITNSAIKCIRIVSGGKHYYINLSSIGETDLLYDEIIECQKI